MSSSSNIKAVSAVSLHNLAPQNSDFAMVNVKMLIEKYGHDVSEKRSEDGMTALHLAAMSDNLPMVKLLLHMGADYNVIDNFGRTPITLAAGESYLYLQSLIMKSKKSAENEKKEKKFGKFKFIRQLFSSKKMKKLFSKSDFQTTNDDMKQTNTNTQANEVQETKKEDYYTPIVKKQPPFNPNYIKNTNTVELQPPIPPRKDYESIDDVINDGCDEDIKNDVSILCNQLKDATFFGSKKSSCKQYSIILNKFSNFENDELISEGTKLDKLLKEEMNNVNTPTKKNKSPNYFNYLLLDPRLANQNDFLSFVGGIFYVGKGTTSRPKAHFIETIKKREEGNLQCEKTKKISELWENGMGVISLQINQNVVEAEALSREAAIIEAININNLTNKKKGEYHGGTGKWSVREKELLGCICLKKAFHMFQIDEPRPIFETDFVSK
uniref:GIY-YIG domain-containing protein n=1 Tax=Strongyloides papillosus TaxID=174720 RepID=A0A0N5B832_STREA